MARLQHLLGTQLSVHSRSLSSKLPIIICSLFCFRYYLHVQHRLHSIWYDVVFLLSNENKSQNVCFLNFGHIFLTQSPFIRWRKVQNEWKNNYHSIDIPKSHLNILENQKKTLKLAVISFTLPTNSICKPHELHTNFIWQRRFMPSTWKLSTFLFGHMITVPTSAHNSDSSCGCNGGGGVGCCYEGQGKVKICISFSFHVYTSKSVVAITLLQLLLNLHEIINIHCKIAWLIVFCFFFIPFYGEKKNVKRDRNKSIERNRECMHVKWTI